MWKNTIRNWIITGIIFLLLLSICVPIISAGEGKPDLTIDEIYVYVCPGGGRGPSWEREYIRCNYSNIGEYKVTDKDIIQFQIVIEKLWLNKNLKRVITNVTTHGYFINKGLEPGQTLVETLTSHFIRALPGFFKIKCIINPNSLVNESNYDNNYCEQIFFGYIGWRTYRWIPVD